MRNPAPQLVFMVLLLGLFLAREAGRDPAAKLEALYVDWLASNSDVVSREAPVTLVAIDDEVSASRPATAWTPLDYALFVDAAIRRQAGVVAIENVLDWTGTKQPAPDAAANERILLNRLRQAPKVVMGARLGFPPDPDVVPPPEPVPVVRRVTGDRTRIPEFDSVTRQAQESLRLAGVTGFTNLTQQGSPVRSVPLVFRYRGEVVPSFVLQAVALWLKATPDEIGVELGHCINIAEKVEIPIDASGNMLVNFRTRFPRLNSDELLVAAAQMEAGQPGGTAPTSLDGGIALLARTDQEVRTLELPNARRGAPGELFAAAIATIQNRAFIRRAPWLVDVLLLGALVFVGGSLWRVGRGTLLLLGVLLLALYLLACLLVFAKWLVWLPLVMPAGVLFLIVAYWLVVRHPATRRRTKASTRPAPFTQSPG